MAATQLVSRIRTKLRNCHFLALVDVWRSNIYIVHSFLFLNSHYWECHTTWHGYMDTCTSLNARFHKMSLIGSQQFAFNFLHTPHKNLTPKGLWVPCLPQLENVPYQTCIYKTEPLLKMTAVSLWSMRVINEALHWFGSSQALLHSTWLSEDFKTMMPPSYEKWLSLLIYFLGGGASGQMTLSLLSYYHSQPTRLHNFNLQETISFVYNQSDNNPVMSHTKCLMKINL